MVAAFGARGRWAVNDGLRFALPFGGRAKINGNVVAIIDRYRQRGPADTEAGGSLLGRMMRDSLDVVVDEVIEPGPLDVRTRYGFHLCDLAHQQAALDAAWKRSAGTCCFLGDWHTHAEPDPTPSSVDLANWHRLLRTMATGESTRLLFVIVGTERVRAWQGDWNTGEIREAAPLDDASAGAFDATVRAAFEEHRALVGCAS